MKISAVTKRLPKPKASALHITHRRLASGEAWQAGDVCKLGVDWQPVMRCMLGVPVDERVPGWRAK